MNRQRSPRRQQQINNSINKDLNNTTDKIKNNMDKTNVANIKMERLSSNTSNKNTNKNNTKEVKKRAGSNSSTRYLFIVKKE